MHGIIRESFGLNARFVLLFFIFFLSFSLMCSSSCDRAGTRTGYYSLCIVGHDKIHGLSCTLGTTRVIQSPGSGSFELIMENVYIAVIHRGMPACDVSNATINILSAGSLGDAASQIGRRALVQMNLVMYDPQSVS